MRNKSAVKRDHIERTPLNIREFEFHLISKKNSRKTCEYLMDMLGSVYSRVIVGLSWDTEANEYFYPLRSIYQLLLPISLYLNIYIYRLLFICLLSIYHLLFILFLSVCLSVYLPICLSLVPVAFNQGQYCSQGHMAISRGHHPELSQVWQREE